MSADDRQDGDLSSAARRAAQYERVLEITRRLAGSLDLDALLAMTVEAACGVLHCERATIFLYDASANELYCRVGTGLEELRFAADRGLAGAAATGRTVVNVPDAYADARFNPQVDRQTGYRTRNVLTFPLESIDGQLYGVLQALNKAGGPFDAHDEFIARTLSAQVGVALHRHALLEQFAEKQRMKRDLDIAQRIQQKQFPRRPPTVPGYDISGWNQPADETGGDCFDFIPLADGRLAVLMADASGHGIGPALVIASARSMIRGLLGATTDLQRIVEHVNRLLADDLADEGFVTAFFGILDPVRHELHYHSCGQGPLLLFDGSRVDRRGASCLPMAVDGDLPIGTAQLFEFAPGARLVLLTDGFFEAANAAGELFGEERVTRVVHQHGGAASTALIAALRGQVQAFGGSDRFADDLTAVVLRRCDGG
ncbi:MAG: SpoIIE family protein phosphatase [Planctomycetia bacterium]|nr:MAG: SpoIIE family protein phosphatase [Planctomycetia bacterium]